MSLSFGRLWSMIAVVSACSISLQCVSGFNNQGIGQFSGLPGSLPQATANCKCAHQPCSSTALHASLLDVPSGHIPHANGATSPSPSHTTSSYSPFPRRHRKMHSHKVVRYRSDDWLQNFLAIPHSFILRRIRFHLLSNTFLCLAIVMLHKFYSSKVSIPMLGHSLLGGFLGLQIVFRTNSAYARFWEARMVWSQTLTTCRCMAYNAVHHIRPAAPNTAKRFLQLLSAFPDALCDTCLGGSTPLSSHVAKLLGSHVVEEKERRHGGTVSTGAVVSASSSTAFTTATTSADLPHLDDPAEAICHELHRTIIAAQTENPTAFSTNDMNILHLSQLSQDTRSLVSHVTHCETLVRTPVPLSYSRHTSRCLTLWCGTLPLALVKALGWTTVPVVMATCWCLFGIEEIGHLIEQPFVGDRGLFRDDDQDEEDSDSVGEHHKKKRKGRRGGTKQSSKWKKMFPTERTTPYDVGIPVYSLAREVRREVMGIGTLRYAFGGGDRQLSRARD